MIIRYRAPFQIFFIESNRFNSSGDIPASHYLTDSTEYLWMKRSKIS